MSGGVDSSIAAAILIEQGYDVIGATLKLYDYSQIDYDPPDGGCCSLDLIDDARSVCAKLGVPHYVFDLCKEFEKTVIDNFIDQYYAGRTPNPCISCNRFIKWGEMLKIADRLECDYVATGHYAVVDHSTSLPRLKRSADANKDQSYALWGIPVQALERTILPIGTMTKPEVRAKAKLLGFRNAERDDSQEICFVPDNRYAEFVHNKRQVSGKPFEPGPIVDTRGKKVGEHKGYANYTIGQRKGLGISAPNPLYVVRIDVERNVVVVGNNDDLIATKFAVTDTNILVDDFLKFPDISVKIRYRHLDSPANLLIADDGTIIVQYHSPQRAITPGQSAVFYSGDIVLGGGIIDRVLE